jgi:hypothetical protein
MLMLVLLQQHRANQAGDRGVVREDANHTGSALLLRRRLRLDLLIDPLQQVDDLDLAPVVLGEAEECQHVLLGLIHEPSGPGEELSQ